jgi:hypothetical protein
MNIHSKPRPNESKHDRFLRLMQKRLGRVLEEMRLVSQLSSQNYENTEAEAFEVIQHLDNGVKNIAKVFGVPYNTAIGKPLASGPAAPAPQGPLQRGRPLDEVDIAKALEHLKKDEIEEAKELLRAALLGATR